MDIYRYTFVQTHRVYTGFPGGSDSGESACNAGDCRGPAPVDPGIRSGDSVGEDQETTA